MTDAVHRILDIVGTATGLDPQALAAAEQKLRHELGGQQLRIAERPPITLERINAGLRARLPVVEIAAGLGVSRATIYRHLGRKKSQRAAGA
jgi:DNA invertase Pin-like site-specific DNA recombinase